MTFDPAVTCLLQGYNNICDDELCLSQILLPLINQYFKNHCLYFLSTPAKVLGSGGHSSNKEKEMIAR